MFDGVIELFFYFFLAFFLVAAAAAFITKKPFILCLGNMFMLAAAVLVVWSFIIGGDINDGWGRLALLIMWGLAAGSFLVGFILRKVGRAQSHGKSQS